MRILVTTMLGMFLLYGIANAQPVKQNKADNETEEWRYDIECVGVGTQGSYVLKVWSYSKNAKVAKEQSKKNAVHGIVFKGYTGSGQKCPSQRALAPTPGVEDQHRDFFRKFFDEGGDYMKYVSLSGDGIPGAGDVQKVGKQYKIGVVVVVMKDALRKDLEAAGIIRGLNSGF